jgi:hypothetical protein
LRERSAFVYPPHVDEVDALGGAAEIAERNHCLCRSLPYLPYVQCCQQPNRASKFWLIWLDLSTSTKQKVLL